jgi:hypothetical protein
VSEIVGREELLEAHQGELQMISCRRARLANMVLLMVMVMVGPSLDCKPAGVKDPADAAALNRKACDGGELRGCTRLGFLYEQGTGVVQDAARTAALHQKACDGGEMGGCTNLGVSYEQGTGVVQDAAKAAALYRKACDGGDRRGCAKAR